MSSHPTPPHQPHPYSCVLASIPPVPSVHVLVVEQVAPEECDRDAQHAREEALLPDVRTVDQAGWEGEVRLPLALPRCCVRGRERACGVHTLILTVARVHTRRRLTRHSKRAAPIGCGDSRGPPARGFYGGPSSESAEAGLGLQLVPAQFL